ncbi:tetratricopeptide repeat protein, partial [Sphingobacteriales bacterium UPWRP_1]
MTFHKGQTTLVIICTALVLALYFLGQRTTNTPATDNPMSAAGMSASVADSLPTAGKTQLNMAQLAQNMKTKISKAGADSITYWETKAQNSPDAAAKTRALKEIARLWEKERYIELGAYYYRLIAQTDSTQNNWLEAANRQADAFQIAADSTMRVYLIENAIDAYEKTLRFDTSQTEVKVNLANCYFDGYPNMPPMVMKGVMMLREVTAKDSTHVGANLSLGRMSVMSGQFDKAINRFQTVLRKDATNAEAYYYLGEAYAAMGQKEKAREAFENCKK